MAHTDVFQQRPSIPLFDVGRVVADRPVRKGSAMGSALRVVLLAALLGVAGYGGLQWWKWHHAPSWVQDAAGSDESSTANDHLPASLPEIRVKDRGEPW